MLAVLLTIGASEPVQTIRIRVHPVGDVCLGNCANYQVIVRSDGLVTSDTRRNHWRFHISRQAYADFKRTLSVAQPGGETIDRAACERWGALESAEWRPDVDEIDIAWDGDGRHSRLVTCDLPDAASTAFITALRSIGVDNGSGDRWRHEPTGL
jgi:hypothetical protein